MWSDESRLAALGFPPSYMFLINKSKWEQLQMDGFLLWTNVLLVGLCAAFSNIPNEKSEVGNNRVGRWRVKMGLLEDSKGTRTTSVFCARSWIWRFFMRIVRIKNRSTISNYHGQKCCVSYYWSNTSITLPIPSYLDIFRLATEFFSFFCTSW